MEVNEARCDNDVAFRTFSLNSLAANVQFDASFLGDHVVAYGEPFLVSVSLPLVIKAHDCIRRIRFDIFGRSQDLRFGIDIIKSKESHLVERDLVVTRTIDVGDVKMKRYQKIQHCDDDVAEEDYENVEDLFDGSEKARLPFRRETVFSCVENLNITFGKGIHGNKVQLWTHLVIISGEQSAHFNPYKIFRKSCQESPLDVISYLVYRIHLHHGKSFLLAPYQQNYKIICFFCSFILIFLNITTTHGVLLVVCTVTRIMYILDSRMKPMQKLLETYYLLKLVDQDDGGISNGAEANNESSKTIKTSPVCTIMPAPSLSCYLKYLQLRVGNGGGGGKHEA
ncbi:hypothetical protein LXL04_020332 [Taraxacum kok-saghyz]